MAQVSLKKILIVEDSDEDYTATMRAFGKLQIENPVYRCIDGDEVLDYLNRQNKFKDLDGSPYPLLILLDLNLPNTDGREVLLQIKRDDRLRKIPLIVLSTSNNQADINDCYKMGANSYLVKQVNFDRFVDTLQALKLYWLETSVLPEDKIF